MKKNLYVNLAIIAVLYFLAIFADFITPLSPTETPENKISYAPPIKVNFTPQRGFYFHPLTLKISEKDFSRVFSHNQRVICKISFLTSVSQKGYKLWNLINLNIHFIHSPNCPDAFNLLGTDKLGRDYLSRLIHGLRPGLFAGLIGILISFPLGIIYGTIAGYKSGAVGELMMRLVEIILSLPTLYLLVALAALLPASLSNMQRLLLITLLLALIGWAGLARIVRGQVLSIRNKEFVQSAYLAGKPTWKIIVFDIIPQLSSYLIIALTLSFPSYILGETTLSFLGLGINQPEASLGNILSEGRELSNLFLRPWLAVGSSLILILLTWCFNSLGDQLRDIFDIKEQSI